MKWRGEHVFKASLSLRLKRVEKEAAVDVSARAIALPVGGSLRFNSKLVNASSFVKVHASSTVTKWKGSDYLAWHRESED